MKILRTPDEMRAWSREQRAAGRSIGLVPTMGALHDGHRTLIEASAARDEVTVVSVFVNPAQFAPHEDFDRYPRAFEADCRLIEAAGGVAVYAPDARTMYPKGYATYIEVTGLQEGLCGKTRPHFFRGVATVVTKLFTAVEPDRAYFGLKDGQQAIIIERMTRDLDFGIEIVTVPTVREADGLAMSSRNAYLSAEERERGLNVSRALLHGLRMLDAGERDAAAIVKAVKAAMQDVEIDYVELVDTRELKPVARVDGPVMLAAAAFVGKTRLIDNVRFEPIEQKETKGTKRIEVEVRAL
jgi:pantoate--beta-alanine ligase